MIQRNDMTLRERVAAMHALCGDSFCLKWSDLTLKWYVEADVEISDGHTLSAVVEHRDTPEEALEAFWSKMIKLKGQDHLVVHRAGKQWRGRWNGFMWEERA